MLFTLPAPVAHAAAPQCEQAIETGQPKSAIPSPVWPQTKLNFIDAWAQTRGEGVKVAVIDSGVDASHPQLKGRVKTLDVTKTNLTDCVGHGTEVAGIIGAQDLRQQGVPFVGVAPGAEIISIKAAVGARNNNPLWAAQAINKAVDLGARVINLSSSSADIIQLRNAVNRAKRNNVVIVAAAGNIQQDQQNQTPRTAYPAGYPGVISVGALNRDGTLATFSNKTTPVTVTAPGQQVISTWPQGTYHMADGTSQAAPFVAGTAALIISKYPKLTYLEVIERIKRTADGATGAGTGDGVVNPLRAITTVGGGDGALAPAAQRYRVQVNQPPPEDRTGKIIALSVAGATLVAALAVGVAAFVVPAGRRRGWRPGN